MLFFPRFIIYVDLTTGTNAISNLIDNVELTYFKELVCFLGLNTSLSGRHYGMFNFITVGFDTRGLSRVFLASMICRQMPSLRCGPEGDGNCGNAYYPYVWIMTARRLHSKFVSRTLGLRSTAPGTDASALVSAPSIPINCEFVRLIKSTVRLRTADFNHNSNFCSVQNLFSAAFQLIPAVSYAINKTLSWCFLGSLFDLIFYLYETCITVILRAYGNN